MPPLDADLIAMLDRVRKIFGDEILADIYERAAERHNSAGRVSGAGPRALFTDMLDFWAPEFAISTGAQWRVIWPCRET